LFGDHEGISTRKAWKLKICSNSLVQILKFKHNTNGIIDVPIDRLSYTEKIGQKMTLNLMTLNFAKKRLIGF
jgi:hypothetical protein